VKLWRLDPRRSLRWRVWRNLNARRTVRGWARIHADAPRILRRSDWRLAFAAGFGLCLPLIGYFGHNQPDWLITAWQVSGVLVTLVLALVIFLLQAAAAQSLRTAATYRALVGSTWLTWPLALTLTFIVWAAAVGRFSDPSSAPPAWVDSYALGLFAIQIAGFAAVFVRMLQLVSPQSVLRVIEQAFTDDISAAVKQKLRRKEGELLFAQAAESAGVRSGPFSSVLGGRRIEARRSGRVVDVDLKLPDALKDFGAAERVSVGVGLGARVQPTNALARARELKGDWLDRTVRDAFAIRPTSGQQTQPLDVFSEALDLARRAVKDGSQARMADAADLVLACITALPLSYRVFGAEYDASTISEGLRPRDEDQMLYELRRFVEEVLCSGSDYAVTTFTQLGFRVVVAGVDDRAPYLVSQGRQFWSSEASIAVARTEPPRREQVLNLLSELAKTAIDQLRYQLQDETLPDEARYDDAVPALMELFDFQATLLRITAESDDRDTFERAWKRSADWNPTWTPDIELDDLKIELEFAQVPERRQAASKLRALETAAKIKLQLDQAHQLATFQTGAWLAGRMRDGSLGQARWDELCPYLIGVFPEPQDIVDALASFLADDRRLGLLRAWQDERLIQGASFRPAAYKAATQWAIVLLLRATAENQPPAIDLRENGETLGRLIDETVEKTEGEQEKWASAVNGDLPAKAEQVKAAVTTARQAAAVRAAEVLAESELNPERVEGYADRQRELFAQRARLRTAMEAAGALTIEQDSPADGNPLLGEVFRKELFLGDVDPVVVDPNPPGQQAAIRQQQAIAGALAEAAELVQIEDALDGAARAIEQMRADGVAPDAVLTPNRAHFRPTLAGSPDFRWSHRDPRDRKGLGYLRDVPVLDVLPPESDHLLVVNFLGAVNVTERRESGQHSPLRIEVRPIDAERAAALIDGGRVAQLEQVPRDDLIRALVDYNVEIVFEVGYEITVKDTARDAIKRFRV
jgi:hypothetical protein